MKSTEKQMEELTIQALETAYQELAIKSGGAVTMADAALVVLQAQISALAAVLFTDEERLEWMRGVTEIIKHSIAEVS